MRAVAGHGPAAQGVRGRWRRHKAYAGVGGGTRRSALPGVGGRARPPQPAPGPPAAPGARGSGGPPVQPAAAAHAAAEGTSERSGEWGRGALGEEGMGSGCVGTSGGQARVEESGSDWWQGVRRGVRRLHHESR